MVVRKQVNNPTDFFDEAFTMYQEGFSANGEFENFKKEAQLYNLRLGESWIGLDNLHTLTTQDYYALKITMTDYDGNKYMAVYDHFKVG